MATTIEPGIIDGLSNSEYHGARDWLGSTSLKTLALKTPAHYKHESEHHVFKDAWNIGTAAHSLILEGDTSNIEVLKFENYLTKAAKEAKAVAIAENKQPLLPHEWDQVLGMRDAVMAQPKASKLLTGHIAEQSLFWEEGGLKFKARPDAQNLGLIGDLKTTVNADPKEFERTAYKFGYFISAAHYQDGFQALTGDRPPFVFVNVEKTAPYLVSIVEFDDESLDWGSRMLVRAKRIYEDCTESGKWPGYAQYTKVGLPRWAEYELEELEDE